MSNLIKEWMRDTTPAQQIKLAKLAGTSRTYLYQLANGTRKASADLATRIENAAEILSSKEFTGLLPKYFVSESCKGCQYTGPRKTKI